MYHYVYRITNIINNKHYYGKRSCKIEPKFDLGKKYFSSSTDAQFKEDQLINPNHYKYKIVQKFNFVEEALQREIKLHNIFDVAKNDNFYNKAKQTSLGFDTTGVTPKRRAPNPNAGIGRGAPGIKKTAAHIAKIVAANSGKSLSEERKYKIAVAHTGKKQSNERKQQHSYSISGIKNSKFSGYFVTPLFITAIAKRVVNNGMLTKWCKISDKKISKSGYTKNNYLHTTYTWEYLNGKTFKDIGFSFIHKDEYITGCSD